jgi:hypothetical protein
VALSALETPRGSRVGPFAMRPNEESRNAPERRVLVPLGNESSSEALSRGTGSAIRAAGPTRQLARGQ